MRLKASATCLLGGCAGFLLTLCLHLYVWIDDPYKAYRYCGLCRGTPIMIGTAAVVVSLVYALRKYSLRYGRPVAGVIVGLIAGFRAVPQTSMSPRTRSQLVEHDMLYEFDQIALMIGCIAVGAAIGTLCAKMYAGAPNAALKKLAQMTIYYDR